MKATNNTRKISKMISFLMILSLLTSNAIAQKSFKKNSLYELKSGMNHDNKADIIKAFNFTIDPQLSEDLMIEDWMKTSSEWTEKSKNPQVSIPESLNRDQVEIVNWMIEPDLNKIIAKENKKEKQMTTAGSLKVKNELVQKECGNNQSIICSKD